MTIRVSWSDFNTEIRFLHLIDVAKCKNIPESSENTVEKSATDWIADAMMRRFSKGEKYRVYPTKIKICLLPKAWVASYHSETCSTYIATRATKVWYSFLDAFEKGERNWQDLLGPHSVFRSRLSLVLSRNVPNGGDRTFERCSRRYGGNG